MRRVPTLTALLSCITLAAAPLAAQQVDAPRPPAVEPVATPQAPVDAAPPVPEVEPVPAAAPAVAPAPIVASDPGPAPAQDQAAILAQLDAEAGIAQEAASDEPSPLQLYGFADFGYRHLFVDDDNPWLLFLNRHPSMFVGNINVYLDAQIARQWRALFELRFTYLPMGAPRTDLQDDTIERESTYTADYTDWTRSKALGSVMIERAQVEYAAFEFLSFKVGQWLTPYGIWNVDHGSPAIVGVSRPFIIGAALLPERQVGIMADGSVALADDLDLAYMAGLSNGRIDNLPAYEDLDGNKAVTARVALTLRSLGELTIGSSFYTGRFTDAVNVLYFENGSPKSTERVTMQFDEVSYAFDVRFLYEGLLVQSEWIVNDRRFTERGRPLGPNGGLRPDKRNWGGYGLVGYRLPWFTLMPYAKAEYSPEPQSQSIGVADQLVLVTGGLNLRPLPSVVFKLEYVYGHFTDGDRSGFAGNDVQGMDLQLACSF